MTPQARHLLTALEGVELRFDEPLAPHTTTKVGGPAAAWAEVDGPAALEALLAAAAAANLATLVVGNGSNVLFADAGFGGVVIHLRRGFDGARLERGALGPGVHRLEVGAGLSITKLLRVAKDEDIDGLEMLGGVPGTVGGAVRMNAGTALGEAKDALLEAELVLPAAPGDAAPTRRWLAAAELGLSYRRSELPEGAIVTAARWRVSDGTPGMRERLAEVLAYRKRTQPLTMPSCGSVFANPPGDHAGRLIEAAGLKGRRVGGAQVSEQHANWIVNTGAATAADMRALMALCVAEVAARFGVTLRHEVRLLGDWEP
jgi:UDP-N-acetylmuramate dehydrogenase